MRPGQDSVGGGRRHLDYLFIDTHPSLNEETLLTITLTDVLLVVLRPDSQDYQVHLASSAVFCMRNPEHAWTREVERVAARVMA